MTNRTDTALLTSALHTPAFETFQLNIGKLESFMSFLNRGIPGLSQEVRQKVDKIDVTTVQTAEIKQELANSIDNLDSFISGLNTGLDWIPVLMVTIVETYIVDVLVYAAGIDYKLMEKCEMSASYPQIIETSTLEELILGIRYRWAKGFLDEGGPKVWIKRLTGMGARNYSPGLKGKMETLWGIRHLIIHTPGVATSDFVQRHPDFGATVGQKIQVNLAHLREWVDCMCNFVAITDRFFINRLNGIANK